MGGNLAIFVHGFRNSLASAVRSAIGLTADLGITTPLVVWSWPSANHLGMYVYDQGSIEWSRLHFQNFIRAVLSDTRVKRLTLLSHSMGGRLACMGLEAAHGHARKRVIRDAIFAAPDVIAPTFRQTATHYGAAAQRISLYTTTADRALLFSAAIHREHLAGLAGRNILVMRDVETVDATEVEVILSKNHSYALEVEEVIADVRTLLSANLPATDRGLTRVAKDQLHYWLIPGNR